MYLAQISESGAYEDSGVVIVGFKFLDGGPLESMIFQFAGPDFTAGPPGQGSSDIQVEINDQGYVRDGAVSDFGFCNANRVISFAFDHPDLPNIADVRIKVPADMPEHEVALIDKMAHLVAKTGSKWK